MQYCKKLILKVISFKVSKVVSTEKLTTTKTTTTKNQNEISVENNTGEEN